MRKYGFLALAVLALMGVAQSGYAYYDTNTCYRVYTSPMISAPDKAEGRGLGDTRQMAPVLVCPAPCCPDDVKAQCGAFCAAGQVAPGWPYGYCDDWWLRPDTNY